MISAKHEELVVLLVVWVVPVLVWPLLVAVSVRVVEVVVNPWVEVTTVVAMVETLVLFDIL